MPQLKRTRGHASSSSAVDVKLRKVVPVIPLSEDTRAKLMDDLNSMDCIGFATKPWGFKEEVFVRELSGKVSNEWDNTLRAVPPLWTEEVWRSVYSFRPGGFGMAS